MCQLLSITHSRAIDMYQITGYCLIEGLWDCSIIGLLALVKVNLLTLASDSKPHLICNRFSNHIDASHEQNYSANLSTK